VTDRPRLRFFLDEGVPDSVGRELFAHGHEVMILRAARAADVPDDLVCALARHHGVGRKRYRTVGLVKFSCREPRAARRIAEAISSIEHESSVNAGRADRRIFVEVGDAVISTWR
jgi:hypothetical protein